MRLFQIVVLAILLLSALSMSSHDELPDAVKYLRGNGRQDLHSEFSPPNIVVENSFSTLQNKLSESQRLNHESKYQILNRSKYSISPENQYNSNWMMDYRRIFLVRRRMIKPITDNSAPIILVWYGLNQVFGHIGQPQEWINILGNVSDPDGISSLTYSLNGRPQIPLTIGRNSVRLVSTGDFNIEIAVTDLTVGQNQVLITATDNLENQKTETVTVEYFSGNTWPLPYSIDWSTQTQITSVAQIVDGLWTLEADSVRPTIPGYDRLIAIGEMTWEDYEVVVPITIHDNPFPDTGGVGVILRWLGHFQIGTEQPRIGWSRIGAYGYYRFRDSGNHLALRLDQSGPIMNYDVQLDLGTTYLIKMRVDTLPGEIGGFYSLKVWEYGQPEPVTWFLTAQDEGSDLTTGSLLLVAHKIDASFGDVSVTQNSSTTYPLTVNVTGDGSVTKNPDKSSYNYGDEVELTADPASNWIFEGWSGSVDSLTNPLMITMTGSHELTANFAFITYLPIVVKNN